MKSFVFGLNSFPLCFHIDDQRNIKLYDPKRYGDISDNDRRIIESFSFLADVNISGHPNYASASFGDRKIFSTECFTLKYVSHSVENNHLIIIQENESIRVISHYIEHLDSSTLESFTEVINNSGQELILESVSSFVFYALGKAKSYQDTYLYLPHSSWCNEGQWKRYSLDSLGITNTRQWITANKANVCNRGTRATNHHLPMGILQDKEETIFFEIISNNCWEYEIGDFANSYSLCLYGNNLMSHDFAKKLNPGEKFISVSAYLSKGKTINEVIKNFTKLHRSLIRPQKECPVIFNEYMYASWNKPSEESAKQFGPVAKELGADYYVIDCGWHDECENPFTFVGKWEESKTNYPHGLMNTLNYLRSLGLKVGLWIEPEVIGRECSLVDSLDKDMFFHKFGKPICTANRYQLDFTNQKAFDFALANVCKIIDKYQLDYVKFDYNTDPLFGTDRGGQLLGVGLYNHCLKVLEFYQKIKEKYPHVILEGCASGGNRLDYQTLSTFDICSISDQENYIKYQSIVTNIYASVLPEQGAIWACPVQPDNNQSDEDVVMIMINTMLGRIHLASKVNLLNPEQRVLVKESLDVYKSYSSLLNKSYPYLPKGFSSHNDKEFVRALVLPEYDLVAFTTLDSNIELSIPLNKKIKSVEVIYPSFSKTEIDIKGSELLIKKEPFSRSRLLKVTYEQD